MVHDPLRESGNEVYKIGYEAILPGLAKIEESFNRNTVVGEKIRAIPDFFVIDRSGRPHLVEVKFRWHPAGHESDYKRIERFRSSWEEALIIFVNCYEKPYFRVSRFPFIDRRNKIATEALQTSEAFGISKELLDKFDALVEKYLTPTLTTPPAGKQRTPI